MVSTIAQWEVSVRIANHSLGEARVTQLKEHPRNPNRGNVGGVQGDTSCDQQEESGSIPTPTLKDQ